MITVADLISGFEASEAWRPVVGYEGVYEVSSFGRVRRVAPAFGANPGQVLAPIVNFGYLHVDLSCENVVQRYRIHRLVADAFIGLAPFSDALVAHNDGDKTNNRVGNLRWASALENQADRARHKTKIQGSDVRNAKLTESDIPAIRRRAAAGERYADIADDYGVSISTISLIKIGRIWKHTIGETAGKIGGYHDGITG